MESSDGDPFFAVFASEVVKKGVQAFIQHLRLYKQNWIMGLLMQTTLDAKINAVVSAEDGSREFRHFTPSQISLFRAGYRVRLKRVPVCVLEQIHIVVRSRIICSGTYPLPSMKRFATALPRSEAITSVLGMQIARGCNEQ